MIKLTIDPIVAGLTWWRCSTCNTPPPTHTCTHTHSPLKWRINQPRKFLQPADLEWNFPFLSTILDKIAGKFPNSHLVCSGQLRDWTFEYQTGLTSLTQLSPMSYRLSLAAASAAIASAVGILGTSFWACIRSLTGATTATTTIINSITTSRTTSPTTSPISTATDEAASGDGAPCRASAAVPNTKVILYSVQGVIH